MSGNAKWTSCLGKDFCSYDSQHALATCPNNPTCRLLTERNENPRSPAQSPLHRHTPRTTYHPHAPTLKTISRPRDEQTDKNTTTYSYNKTLHGNQTDDTLAQTPTRTNHKAWSASRRPHPIWFLSQDVPEQLKLRDTRWLSGSEGKRGTGRTC